MVEFRHNSLALRGHIRSVTATNAVRALTENPRTLPPVPPHIELPQYLQDIVGREGMHELPHGIKGHYAVRAFRLLDGRRWYDAEVFCARTTLVRKANGSWIQIENSADYNYEAIPYGPIANRGCECITLFRMESFGEGFFDGQGMTPKASTRFAPDPADEEMSFLAGPAMPEQPRTPEAEGAQPRPTYLPPLGPERA